MASQMPRGPGGDFQGRDPANAGTRKGMPGLNGENPNI
jgi:hypothetical protein